MSELLDQALGIEPQQAVEAEPVQEAEQEATASEEQTTGETSEPPSEPAQSAENAEPTERQIPFKAYEDERGKRQELERQLKELQAEKDKAPIPDVLENPEGYSKAINDQFDQKLLEQRLEMSEFLARRDYEDMDQRLEEYRALVEKIPALHSQVMKSQSPWHEMAKTVENHREMEQLKDVDGMKAKMRQELEAEIRKEYETKAKSEKSLSESLPQSLAGAASKGTVKGSEWSGPTPLDNIL